MTKKTPILRISLLAAVIGALVLVPLAVAGKSHGGAGSTSGSSTISLAPLVYDANANGLPNWNDTVTFTISTTATTQPYVNVKCYQNGILVYNTWRGFFAQSMDPTWNFVLSSGVWTGGPADCTAYLDMYTNHGLKQLASTSFHVDA